MNFHVDSFNNLINSTVKRSSLYRTEQYDTFVENYFSTPKKKCLLEMSGRDFNNATKWAIPVEGRWRGSCN